jgi:hypothetical protein
MYYSSSHDKNKRRKLDNEVQVDSGEESSVLLNLENKIWNMIAEYVGPLYKDSLRRTSKFFSSVSDMISLRKISIFSIKPIYVRDEPNPSVKFIQWAIQNGCPWDTHNCSRAAEEGHLDVLKLLRQNGAPWNEDTCAAAAYKGYLHVLKWLRENGCPWDWRTCSYAAEAGHIEVLKWCRKNGCPWNEWTCYGALEGENIDVLIWLDKQDCPCGSGDHIVDDMI